MTNAPTDLLGLRSRLAGITGLSDPSALGIVGDAAHAATGGYHEGRSDLAGAGVYSPSASAGSGSQDYSVRLSRDRAGLTESASAMDISYQWPRGGNSAWLRFNNQLVGQLHANDPALAAIRAVNYTPDGSTRLRTDRELGWSVVGSSDVVDIHTHIEWYRDTENRRQACIDRLAALAQASVDNRAAPSSGTASQEDDDDMNGQVPTGAGKQIEIICRGDRTVGVALGVDTLEGTAASGPTSQYRARVRVARHLPGHGWRVDTVDLGAADDRKTDLPAADAYDRITLTRQPIDETDTCEAPVGYLTWY